MASPLKSERFKFAWHALSESGGFWWMRRPRMVIVQIKCELTAKGLVTSHGIFEQLFLKIARKDRPKLQRRSPHHMFKT